MHGRPVTWKGTMSYDTIPYEEDDAIGWLMLNRPDDGNMFTATMCLEIRDCMPSSHTAISHQRCFIDPVASTVWEVV